MNCVAKIRPFPGPTVIVCENEVEGHTTHAAVLRDYAYPGSETVVSWDEDDRRTFRGEWSPCTSPGCILPLDHRGRHAS
jgi:hypothetical protein